MIGRVSFNSNYDLMVRNVQGVSARYRQALTIASSGKQVNTPYDDPGAYSRVLQGRTQKQEFYNYQKGTGTALQEMQTADSVLATANDRIVRAQELAVLGASATYSAEDLVSMAEEVAAIRDDVLLVANTRFNNRYIFAGSTYDQAAYDDTGLYQGNSEVRQYIAGENYTLAVNIPGDEVFGSAAGGVDIFAVLDTLEAELLANNPTGVRDTLNDLDAALSQLSHARTVYGARVNQAEELKSFYDLQTVAVTERVSQEEDADAVAAYTDLAQLSTAMQATLQVSANVSKLSLLDYL